MTIKTPAEIAQSIADQHDFAAVGDLRNPEQVHEMMADAIETDRKQRDVYELIAEALDDRSDWDNGEGERAQLAAALVRAGTEDSIWDRHFGPMLDDLMKRLGESANQECSQRRGEVDPLDESSACAASIRCKVCGENITSDDVHASDGMCGSCNHNATRSGA